MVMRVRYKNFNQLSFADVLVYSKLPEHPFWSAVERVIDFSFADTLCAVLYTGIGQHPYAPSLKLKIHLVQSYYALSDRRNEEKIIGDLFIKRFLQLPVDFFGFDHSTIGLDRSRMGEAMFRACHFYILAQMYHRGLWGEHNEQWIIDSFPTPIALVRHGARRLIQQAMIRLIQHVRKRAPQPACRAFESLPLDAIRIRLSASATDAEHMLAFSKLVAQAYALLHWFENEHVMPLLKEWKYAEQSQQLRAILRRILEENSRETTPEEPLQPGQPAYEKIPKNKRPKDRIESAVDPQARTAVKRSKVTVGYKTQNLCTTGGVILDTRTIPASEHDQQATAGMVATLQRFFSRTPAALIGDAAYGYGPQRVLMARQGVHVIAPVPVSVNPTGLFPIASFVYDADRDAFTCPGGQQNKRRSHNAKLEGAQYFFDKKVCAECPLRAQCTTNETGGRTVFRSDYASVHERAQKENASVAGQEALRKRKLVERKNQELKNDCGLGRTKTRSRLALQLKATCAAIVVNLKHAVRKLLSPNPGFLRRARASFQ